MCIKSMREVVREGTDDVIRTREERKGKAKKNREVSMSCMEDYRK